MRTDPRCRYTHTLAEAAAALQRSPRTSHIPPCAIVLFSEAHRAPALRRRHERYFREHDGEHAGYATWNIVLDTWYGNIYGRGQVHYDVKALAGVLARRYGIRCAGCSAIHRDRRRDDLSYPEDWPRTIVADHCRECAARLLPFRSPEAELNYFGWLYQRMDAIRRDWRRRYGREPPRRVWQRLYKAAVA